MADDTAKKLAAGMREIEEAVADAVGPDVMSQIEEGLGTIPEPRPEVEPHGMQIVERHHDAIEAAVRHDGHAIRRDMQVAALTAEVMGDARVVEAIAMARRSGTERALAAAQEVAQHV